MLNHAEDIISQNLREVFEAGDVFTSSDRHARGLSEATPIGARPIGADRLLRPAQIECDKPWQHLQRLRDRPTLIGVGGEHAKRHSIKLAESRFFLISRCTRRAHAAL
ncbi:hypothetical protein MA20_45705 [Bradyrhizobium japonicum]|uniref:Uncharacterized protein n=1 Tax=Bradyrhizobium japonicum TaxID=375 RepID=A0A0A3YHI8_BRAJP|nr:hypothetical protein MA20_45705 [Bradyrhizobium japonicum]